MLTTEERQIEFVELVKEMRAAQKEFLKSKSQTVLEDARFYERQVDRALRRMERSKKLQREFFGA